MTPCRLLPAAFLLMTSLACAQTPRRVACAGDSITFGDKIPDRATQSYPAVLERLSNGRFLTGNFGVNGATALAGTGRAWTDTFACRDALGQRLAFCTHFPVSTLFDFRFSASPVPRPVTPVTCVSPTCLERESRSGPMPS